MLANGASFSAALQGVTGREATNYWCNQRRDSNRRGIGCSILWLRRWFLHLGDAPPFDCLNFVLLAPPIEDEARDQSDERG